MGDDPNLARLHGPRRGPRRAGARLLREGRRYGLAWLSLGSWRRRAVLAVGALSVGVAAILFAKAGDWATARHRDMVAQLPLLALLAAPAGFALMAWLSRRWFPGTQGSGIPQTIAALHTPDRQTRARLLSLRIAAGKILLTVGGMLAGASTGREGPSVQVGAAIMHSLSGRRLLGRVATERNLILAGGAAGVAAAFNTPLAGIIFAIEELSRHSVFRANSTTLATVIFSGLISLAVLGNYTYFGSTAAVLAWPGGVLAVLACGCLGGVAGGVFSRALVTCANGLPGRPGAFARSRPIAFAATCGLLTAMLGLATGGAVFGTGYEEARALLEDASAVPAGFGLAKMAATFLAFLSGIPGGIFAPSLAVGAGLGDNLAAVLPGAPHAAVVLLVMVAYLAGATQSPITAFVIVMEMTANHQMLFPLMAAAVIAHGVSRTISPPPLYFTLAQNLQAPSPR